MQRIVATTIVALLALAGTAHGATFTVNNTGDAGDAALANGICQTASPGVCTLRAAIEQSEALAGADTIGFSLPNPSTINLTGSFQQLASQLTIAGPGASALTVRRNVAAPFHVFLVGGSANVAISDMTISNGLDDGTPGPYSDSIGGGILNIGTLTLDRVVVSGNAVTKATGAAIANARGGGIGNLGTLTIRRSTIADNSSTASTTTTYADSDGGGIVVAGGGHADIFDSTINNNTVLASGGDVNSHGGGLGLLSGGTANLTNVTISANSVTGNGPGTPVGGGIGLYGGSPVNITSSTIAFNTSVEGANVGGFTDAYLRNTIVSDPLGGGPDCFDIVGTLASDGFNLSSDASCNFVTATDQQNVNPLLQVLGDYGGPTHTHELAFGSPAVDHGSAAAAGVHPALSTDQRGEPRPIDILTAANGAASDTADIGAFELQRDTYASSVVALEPAGYWRFGEPPGSTTLIDFTAKNPNGTYLGGVTLGQPGIPDSDIDTAALYDGINDTGRVPDTTSAMDVGNSFTLEGWIKRSSDAKTHELFNKGANGFQLVVMNGASLNRVLLRRAGVTTIAQSTTPVPADGAYHHVVATMNGPGTALIYIDGQPHSTSLSPTQQIADTAFPLTFGSAGSTPATYDEFALYDQVLGAAEIQQHYEAGIAP